MKSRYTSVLFHVIAWIVFLSIPVLIFPSKNEFAPGAGDHFRLAPVFINGIFLITLFYLNYYYLIPKFFFTKKYLAYTLLCLGSLFLTMSIPFLFFTFFSDHQLPRMPFDPHFQNKMPIAITNTLLMYIVAFFASIFLRVNTLLKKTEKERLSAQLSYLKTQINPHFLFNTLNSIYGVTIGKAPQGAEMIDKLSEMMRYTLKEAQLDIVPLESEINYIINYIDLQKVRFDNSVKFSFDMSGNFMEKQITPLLLIPFIENAFKHGVNSEQDSNIKIKLGINENELHLQVFNNKVQIAKYAEPKSGLGIQNTKHRLELIYPDKHLLNISETENDFSVSLKITLT